MVSIAIGAFISTWALPIMITGATIHGGITGGEAGEQAKKQVCTLNKNIQDYIKTSQTDIELYSQEFYESNQQVLKLRDNISLVQQDVKIAHDNYKKSMTFFTIFGISLAIVLIFILVTKKVILHETALPGK